MIALQLLQSSLFQQKKKRFSLLKSFTLSKTIISLPQYLMDRLTAYIPENFVNLSQHLATLFSFPRY